MVFNRQTQFLITQSSSSEANWVLFFQKFLQLVGVHALLVKSGGHLRDHVSYRTASSAESLSLSSFAFLAALFFGFFLDVDVDILASVACDYPQLPAATASGKKLRAAARARAAAKRLAQAKEGCGVLSTAQLLRQSSVAPTTRRAYEIGVREFETYARNHKWKLKSGSAVDEDLAKYGATMYELGDDAGPMRAAISGIALFRPDPQLPAKNPFRKAG